MHEKIASSEGAVNIAGVIYRTHCQLYLQDKRGGSIDCKYTPPLVPALAVAGSNNIATRLIEGAMS